MKYGAIIFILFYLSTLSVNAQQFRSNNGFPVEQMDKKTFFTQAKDKGSKKDSGNIAKKLERIGHLEFTEESSIVLQHFSEEGFISYTRSKVLSRSYLPNKELSEIESSNTKL